MMDRVDGLVAESEVSEPLVGEVLPPEAGTNIVVAVEREPALVLLDNKKFDEFYESLKAQAPANADVTTSKGRQALKSFAADVRSKKAAIDKDRLRLTKDWRDMISQVNEVGSDIRDRLESLAITVRQPLTDWEDAEKARVDECRATIQRIWEMAVVQIEDSSAAIRARGTEVYGIALDPERFGDMLEEAQAAKDKVIGTLKDALAIAVKREADEAELTQLRREKEERDAKEAEEAAARERKAQHDRYIESLFQHIRDCGIGIIGGEAYPYPIIIRELTEKIVIDEEWGERAEEGRQLLADTIARVKEVHEKAAEARRLADEKAEADRIAKAKEEAAETARAEEKRKADEAIAAERKRAEDAEAAAAAERKKREDEDAERKATEEKLAAEQRQRDEDKAHRARVRTTIKQALMTCGADEETAKKIVLALQAGEIPHVTMRF